MGWGVGGRQPGPAFNYGAAVAFEEGADFFYRVNDDSLFQTRSDHISDDHIR